MVDTWKRLKDKQKCRVTEMMFSEFCEVYRKTGKSPKEEQYEELVRNVHMRCNIKKLNFDNLLKIFIRKQKRFEERIEIHGLPEVKKRVKKTKAEKLAIKRASRKRKKEKREQTMLERQYIDQDENFYYIAGYTSNGVPYGVTWDEVENPDLYEEDK